MSAGLDSRNSVPRERERHGRLHRGKLVHVGDPSLHRVRDLKDLDQRRPIDYQMNAILHGPYSGLQDDATILARAAK